MKHYILNDHDEIVEALESMSNHELMYAHNQYCENANYMDDQIFYNDEEFADTMFNSASDFQMSCEYGDYRGRDEFVQFNGYANLESFNWVSDVVDFNAIANDIQENERSYYNITLEEVEEEEEN